MTSAEEPPSLSQLMISAFCERSIRSAVLIDEQFPKLSDALAGFQNSDSENSIADKYPEWERAKELYEAFHGQKITCDVENDPGKLGELSEKIRKSDLVVLDLHLQDSADATESIEVLKSLAANNRFNLVVVYTKDNKLRKIAIELAGSIRGKQAFEDAGLENVYSSVKDDIAEFDLPAEQMAIDHICGNPFSGASVGGLRGKLASEHKIPKDQHLPILAALAVHFLEDHYGAIPGKIQSVAHAINLDCKNPWMVFPNVFVVVAHKGTTSPNELLTVIKNAILDWNPGIVRTIIAQIQNTIADNGYAFAESLANDLETQVAWLWHASRGGAGEPAAIEMLIQRMVLSLRATLSSDGDLSEFVSSCIATLPDLADPLTQLAAIAKTIAVNDIGGADVLHALNCFESTEPFSTNYITTGTVLFSKHPKFGNQWWVCVEPACDTIPNQASSQDNFLHCRLLEVRSCTSEKEDIARAATRSRYIFVNFGSRREFLDSLNETSAQPKPVTGFVKKEGQVVGNLGDQRVSVFFPDKSLTEIGFFEVEMHVVAQLREPYANRLLQETGSQLSRIGLNFVDLPKKSIE